MKNIIICASPRHDGNSDFVANLITKKLEDSEIIKLSSKNNEIHNIQACISCGYCTHNISQCSLNYPNIDQAGKIFNKLFVAQQIYFVSPIYFYHLPSQLKALMDRTQAWFNTPYNLKPLKNKSAKIILLGARPQGDNLFKGAILTFKYFFEALGLDNLDPLCLYGLDKKNDLKNNDKLIQEIIKYIG